MVAAVMESQPYQILITDDDEACRETVSDALAERGYTTHLAACGREAIEVARMVRLHLVIIDMNMPDLTGLETVTIIRREVRVVLPGILMSAEPSEKLMVRALKASFESFMPKPLHLGALRHVVEQIIRRTYDTGV